MRILQISIEVNHGSVGRIAEQIGLKIIEKKWDSYITYARGFNPSKSKTIRIGNKLNLYYHVLMTRLFDKHCFHSKKSTKKLLKDIDNINPDIIVLHHIHGYFINMQELFNYLQIKNLPVVWIFHDFWSITGHCTHFIDINCEKWKELCYNCPKLDTYPKSWYSDNSTKNYLEKKRLFTSLENLHIVTVSNWVKENIQESFLKEFSIHTIYNSVDVDIFKPNIKYPNSLRNFELKNKKIVLGVATAWTKNKGLYQFYELANILSNEFQIVLVGLNSSQIRNLPKNIIGIERTENVTELVQYYTSAFIHVSLSLEETFGMTIIESMACGTPAIAYDVCALSEIINIKTGKLVRANDIHSIADSITKMREVDMTEYFQNCREWVKRKFCSNLVLDKYMSLFENLKIN